MTRLSQAEFVARIREHRVVWRNLVAEVGPDRREEPGPMGEWSFRDLAGHLAGWNHLFIARFEATARGEPTPPRPWPDDVTAGGDDAINAWIRGQDESRTTDEVLSDYDATCERLAAAIEALPEWMITDPAAFAWMRGQAIGDSDATDHFREEHEPTLRAWLAGGGAPAA